MSHLSGIVHHRSLRMPPRIWASYDRVDLALDLSVRRVPRSMVCVFAVSSELPSADEIFYLILQVEAHCSRVTVRVVEQAELVLVLLWDLLLYRYRGSKIYLTPS